MPVPHCFRRRVLPSALLLTASCAAFFVPPPRSPVEAMQSPTLARPPAGIFRGDGGRIAFRWTEDSAAHEDQRQGRRRRTTRRRHGAHKGEDAAGPGGGEVKDGESAFGADRGQDPVRPLSTDGSKGKTIRDVQQLASHAECFNRSRRGDETQQIRQQQRRQQGPHGADSDRPATAALVGPTTTKEEEEEKERDRQRGLLVLLTVPLAWGTFEPAVRYVYRELANPVPPFVFSLLYYSVAAASLALLAVGTSNGNKSDPSITAATALDPSADRSDDWPVRGGIELGTYLFVGNALQLLGLQTIASDRAAFLLQLTTLFVPLAEAAASRSVSAVPSRVWAACPLALLGVFVMGLDDDGAGQGGGSATAAISAVIPPTSFFSSLAGALATVSLGDLCVVGAAVAYTFHCIRLEPYAQKSSAVRLAACKAATETTWTALSVLGFVAYYSSHGNAADLDMGNALSQFAAESGRDIVGYVEGAWNGLVELSRHGDGAAAQMAELPSEIGPTAAAVLWTGWVTVAYTIYAQSYGQRRVPPVTANLIYTIQPVCTALVAWLVLGETLGPAGYAGGALIGAAVLLVTTTTTTSTTADEKRS